MPTLEEMTTWTVADIDAAIRRALPADLFYDRGFDPAAGTWFTRFWRLQDGQKQTLYEDWGFEQRIAYFNAYGWLWAQQQPAPSVHSPWKPRGDVTATQVQRKARNIPDPADLDPNEVESVYAGLRGHPKKG